MNSILTAFTDIAAVASSDYVPLSRPGRGVDGGQAVIEGVMMRSPALLCCGGGHPSGSMAVTQLTWNKPSDKASVVELPILAVWDLQALFLGCRPALLRRAALEKPERVQNKKTHGIEWLDGWAEICLSPGLLHCSVQACPLYLATWPRIGIFDKTANLSLFADRTIKCPVSFLLILICMEGYPRFFDYHGAEHKCLGFLKAGPINVEGSACTRSSPLPRVFFWCHGISMVVYMFCPFTLSASVPGTDHPVAW